MERLFATSRRPWKTPSRSRRRCAFRATTRDPILPRFAEDEIDELRRQAEAQG